MDDQHAVARHYAILIGIDAYPSSSLTSCVRDVQVIKRCLEGKLSSLDIQTLTASKNPDPEILTPLEDPEFWPTHRNVTSVMEKVTSQAEPGDFVYVHYSGHGTRLPARFEYSNQSTGDLALVLLGEDCSSESFLQGARLAGFLKAMVVKGLIVTLVLDCCFSSSVYRNTDSSVRYFSTRSSDLENSLAGRDTRSANRDASMRDNWLLHPDQYAILASCGPDENAKSGFEVSEKGLRYGALSYSLSETLSIYGLGERHKDIHRHLRAKFWKSCIAQHPVLFGNADQGFFGRVKSPHSVRSINIIEREGCLQLLAGQAHGFRDGDQFSVSPAGSSDDHRGEKGTIATAIRVGALTSVMELSGPLRNPGSVWAARPLTSAYLASFPIQLAHGLPQRDEWLAALKERSLGTDTDTHQKPALRVVLNNIGEYEILDISGQKLINLPAMPRDQVDTSRICDVLEHLARFKMAKDLVNQTPTATFLSSFNVQIINAGFAFSPGKQIEVRHNSKVEVAISNMGDTALYAHVYNLGPCWRVKGIYWATYEAVPPRTDPRNGDLAYTGRSHRRITMTVPPIMREHGSCDDIIKVFVTSQPTSFDSLELPNLEQLAETVARNRVSHSTSRESEDWVALDFPIHTLY